MSLKHPTESNPTESNLDDDSIAEPTPAKNGGVPSWFKPVALLAVLATVAIYVLRLDKVVGMTVDDAWYVLLAQGLATGQGYTVANSPSPGILPLYPPGFPFFLSLLYRLAPRFPENVTLLKSVSVLSMLGAGWLTYVYFTKTRALTQPYALLLALSVTLCPPLVFLATSTLMSECFFTLLFLAALVVAERVVAAQRAGSTLAWGAVVLCAVLSAYAFLTRSIALALIGAVFLYWLRARAYRAALAYAVLIAVLTLPWMLYSRAHTPTYEQMREQGGHIIQPYGKQFWQRVASVTTSDEIGVDELPSRVWENILEVTGRDVLRIVAAPLFEWLRDPYKEAKEMLANQSGGLSDKTVGTIPLSYLLGILMFIGYFIACRERLTCAELAVPLMFVLILLWPWETIRFVLPMTPFLIFYLVRAVQSLAERFQPASKWVSALPYAIIGLSLAINCYGHVSYLSRKLSGETPVWIKTFNAAEATMQWVKQNVPTTEPLVSANPPLTYLYTGNKTVSWQDPKVQWNLWRQLRIRHLVRFAAYTVPEERELQNYDTLFLQKEFGFRVVDLGELENRLPWGADRPAR